jgi:anti-anti-sigma factor
MKMGITNVENGITKVVLTGSMNIQGAWETEPQFNELVKTTNKVVVDLTDVRFIDSVGMRTLVVTAKSLYAKGGKLVLASPQAGVEQVLRTAGLERVIPIAPDFSAALALFR